MSEEADVSASRRINADRQPPPRIVQVMQPKQHVMPVNRTNRLEEFAQCLNR
jgi:hypothetical protein